MNVRRTLLAATALLASLTAARAAPATPEEAQRLTEVFQRYIGQPAAGQPSPVTVTPDGESYRVSVDAARLAAPLASAGFSVTKAGDYVLVLTPQSDGTWHVTNDGFPPLAITKGDQTTTLSYDQYRLDGLFDPKIATFRSATSTMAGTSVAVTGGPTASSSQSEGLSDMHQTGEDAGNGSATIVTQQSVTNFAYKLDVKSPPAPGGSPADATTALSIDAHAAKLSGTSTLTRLPVARLLDVWAFFVAHPSKAQIVASQAELKGLLNAVLDSVVKASGQAEGEKLVVGTPKGTFSVGTASEHLALGGDQNNDEITVGLKADGLVLPDGLVPTWASGLVPTAFDITQTIGPVHLNRALRVAVADMDLGADKPLDDAQVSEVVQAFGDLAAMTLTLAPTTITTGLMTVKAQGSARLEAGAPAGSATVSATGLDQAIAALTSVQAIEPQAAQASQFLSTMKALAKSEPDGSYSWTIEAAPGAPVTLNGKPMMPSADQQRRKKKGQKSAP